MVINKLGYNVLQDSGSGISTATKLQYEKFGFSLKPTDGDAGLFPELDEDLFLEGKTFYQHFEDMASDLFQPELDLVDQLYKRLEGIGLSDIPQLYQIQLVSGWTAYPLDNPSGHFPVEAPDDRILILDTETFVKGGNYPIIATAIGLLNSYVWIAPEFITHLPEDQWEQKKLVPLFSDKEKGKKVIIGHNIGFDLQRVRESFSLSKEREVLALDTLSMHVCVAGLSSGQRWLHVLNEKNPDHLTDEDKEKLKFRPPWLHEGAMNSLVAAYNLHTKHSLDDVPELEIQAKEIRNVFVDTETMSDFILSGDFRYQLLDYAMKDTLYTAILFCKLLPKFYSHNPSKVARVKQFLLFGSKAPATDDWHKWIDTNNKELEQDQKSVNDWCYRQIDGLFERWQTDNTFWVGNPWLEQLDWTIDEKKAYPVWFIPFFKKEKQKLSPQFAKVFKLWVNGEESIKEENPDLCWDLIQTNKVESKFYPRWFAEMPKPKKRKLLNQWKKSPQETEDKHPELDWTIVDINEDKKKFLPQWCLEMTTPTRKLISTKSRIIHLLLELEWDGSPIKYIEGSGWCYDKHGPITEAEDDELWVDFDND